MEILGVSQFGPFLRTGTVTTTEGTFGFGIVVSTATQRSTMEFANKEENDGSGDTSYTTRRALYIMATTHQYA